MNIFILSGFNVFNVYIVETFSLMLSFGLMYKHTQAFMVKFTSHIQIHVHIYSS